jgi:hypothetical protein
MSRRQARAAKLTNNFVLGPQGGGNIKDGKCAESFLPKNFGHIGKFGNIGPELLPPPCIKISHFWSGRSIFRQEVLFLPRRLLSEHLSM